MILSFNALEHTARAIASVREYSRASLVVIDNGSVDGSREWLKKQEGYRVILNAENKKYTRGFADYLDISEADIVTLFNNDCLAERFWEDPILSLFADRPRAAIITPILVDLGGVQVTHAGGQIDFCSHYYGMRGMHFEQPIPRLWCTGAVFSLRLAAYRALGGFDRQFEHYCSDSDLCLRAWLDGWEVWSQPRSVVRHAHMVSSRWLQEHDAKDFQKAFDDQRRFNVKWDRHGIRIGKKEPLFELHAELHSGSEDVLTAGLQSWR